jgi:uncharacterized membrane protein
MVLAILALFGLLISLYMLAYASGLVGSMICAVGDCEVVQNSPYSRIGPLPVAAIGVVGYLALMALSLKGLQPTSQGSRMVPAALFGGGAVGLAFTVYLTYLEAFVIHAWCQWCVSSAIIMAMAFLACLPEFRRIGEPI